MKHKVFISYSSKDWEIAKVLLDTLEREGFPCWIAPRNIPEGGDWAEEITKGIEATKYFVLLFNRNSNVSQNIVNEVCLAAHNEVIIFPVMMDDTTLSKSLEYYLRSRQWSNTELLSIDKAAKRLCIRLQALEESQQLDDSLDLDAGLPKKEKKSNVDLKQIESSALAGDAAAQYEIGMAYAQGNGVREDVSRGIYFLDLAARQNHSRAQLTLAQEYIKIDREKYAGKIFDLLTAAAATLAEAKFLLGKCYTEEIGCKKDDKCAFKHVFEAAMSGIPEAMYQTGVMLYKGKGWSKDKDAAMMWLEKSGNLGYEKAMMTLGDNHPDEMRRTYWYGRAVERGNPRAMHNLAVWYLTGLSSLNNSAEAERLFRKAAEMNYVPSMKSLYDLLKKTSPKEAVSYIVKAADNGDVWAQVNAGIELEKGKDIKKDTELAVEYYKKAAMQGDKYGQYYYGQMLVDGKGIKSDVKVGVEWIIKAAEQGLPCAQLWLALPNNAKRIKDDTLSRKWLFKAAAQGVKESYLVLAVNYGYKTKLIKTYLSYEPIVAALWMNKYDEDKDGETYYDLANILKAVKMMVELYTSDLDTMDWLGELWNKAIPTCFSLGDYLSVQLCAKKMLSFEGTIEKHKKIYDLCTKIANCENFEEIPQIISVDEEGKVIEVHRDFIGRNEPCPCGSGKKYKHCCGAAK